MGAPALAPEVWSLGSRTISSAGSVSVLGHDVVADYRRARAHLGVVPQEWVFDPFFNVRELLRIQAGYFGLGEENDPWIDELLEALQLRPQANTMPMSSKAAVTSHGVKSGVNCQCILPLSHSRWDTH